MIKVLNKYLLTEREIYHESNEIGFAIVDSKGRLLTCSNSGYIDIPKIILKHGDDKDKCIKEFLNTILEEKDQEYNELYKLDNYRYRDITDKGLRQNKKAHITYYLVETDSKITDDKYKFLTPSNIDYVLSAVDYQKYNESIKDELEILVSYIKDDYLSKDRLLEFDKKNYIDHLICLLNEAHPKDFIEHKYPFIDYNHVIESTLAFIKNMPVLSNGINGKKWAFSIERINPISAFSNKKWYSDILFSPCRGNDDSLVSLYLLKSFFQDDIKMYLNDNNIKIKHKNKVIGIVKILPELIIEDTTDNTLLETSKILSYGK